MIRVSSSLPLWLCDRARKAFQLANQEAHRLNHRAVGTEHLLLGLAKENISPAAWALRFAGFNLLWLRHQVERCHLRGADDEMLPGTLPYATDLTAYVERIEANAGGRGCMVTTAQLLAGLIRRPESRIGSILKRRRISWWLLRWLLRRVAEPFAAADRPRE
jgi:ATP-dependent Clp protease ATP-binding subunit ClpC